MILRRTSGLCLLSLVILLFDCTFLKLSRKTKNIQIGRIIPEKCIFKLPLPHLKSVFYIFKCRGQENQFCPNDDLINSKNICLHIKFDKNPLVAFISGPGGTLPSLRLVYQRYQILFIENNATTINTNRPFVCEES